MEELKNFIIKYRGAIIGAIIAIIALILQIYRVIIGFLIIALGMIIGNYIQHNKEIVKDAIKRFIDRI